MKVAIVHDFLVQMGGAEKVVEVLHDMFPQAPIYTSAYDPNAMPAYYRTWDIRTSFLQKLLMKKHTHRLVLLLYPMAFESFDLTEFELVISSSSAFAKGIITQPQTTHVCYTHTPMRYAWMTRNYVQNENLSQPLRALLAPGMHYLRKWDAVAAMRVDQYVANSSIVARRISKFYRRDCEIVYPPVDTVRFKVLAETDDYYIIISRFVPYKRLDLAVAAFTRLNMPLRVVGSGRQLRELQRNAGSNITFMGRVDDAELPDVLARARGFIMPGEEDFGIAPVEANACGVPVIAYAAGGALDTQIDGVTGVLFGEQTVDGLCAAVQQAEQLRFDKAAIQAHAQNFDVDAFRQGMNKVIAAAIFGNKRPVHERALITNPVKGG